MAASESYQDTLYQAFEDRIGAHTLIRSEPAVAVIRKDSGDVDDLVAKAKGAAGNSGVCIFISRPRMVPVSAQTPWYQGSFDLEIAEDPTLNRGVGGTAKSAALIEEALVPQLVQWSHSLAIGPIFVRDATVPEEGAGNLRRITFGFGALARAA